jgi:hypothetical protein
MLDIENPYVHIVINIHMGQAVNELLVFHPSIIGRKNYKI